MVNPDLFNEVPLFQLLDAEERRVLAEQVSMLNFKKGDVIYQAGDSGGLAYLVQKGMVHVTIKDANYESIIVDIASDGGLVGMSSLLAGEEHQTTAIAMEELDLSVPESVKTATTANCARVDAHTCNAQCQ